MLEHDHEAWNDACGREWKCDRELLEGGDSESVETVHRGILRGEIGDYLQLLEGGKRHWREDDAVRLLADHEGFQ